MANSLNLIRAIDRLRVLLRGLNSAIPLNITGVMPISAAFRDTAVFNPILCIPEGGNELHDTKAKLKYFSTFPLYVVITLELSGRWPDDLSAFVHMKRLLLIRLHELLAPMKVPSHVTKNNMLDVFLDGFVFRVCIAQLKELGLLKKACPPTDTLINPNDLPACISSVTNWIRLHQSLPILTSTLAGISRSASSVFPPACRLVKRWLSAHGYPVVQCPLEANLDGLRDSSHFFQSGSTTDPTDFASGGRIAEVAVELMVVYASGLSQPMGGADGDRSAATASPLIAFMRFLDLIALHDWKSRPILVDLNEGFADVAKRRTALDTFQQTDREKLPALVICTPLDPSGVEWTSIGPTRSGLNELRRLAERCRTLLRAMLVAGAKFDDLRALFTPIHNKNDIVIKLNDSVSKIRQSESISNVKFFYKKLSSLEQYQSNDEVPSELPAPGARFWPRFYCYDPLAWFVRLAELRLGKHFTIRWDSHGGDWISLRPIDCHIESSVVKFDPQCLDGLTNHVHNDSNCIVDLFLSRDLSQFNRLFARWARVFVDQDGRDGPVTPNKSLGKRKSSAKKLGMKKSKKLVE